MTNTSQVSVALLVNVISYIMTTWLGLNLDNAALTSTIETLIVVGTALWAVIAHKKVAAGKGI